MYEDLQDATKAVARSWWLFIVTGVLWMIYAFIVLSSNAGSVRAVSLLFGIGFIAGGVSEFFIASMVKSWKWAHALFGFISVIAGIVAVAWPEATFVVLAAIIGWYLMFDGVFLMIASISSRGLNDLWWLGLITGIAELAIAVWAVGYSGRSVALLIIWVGAAAITRGITQIVVGLTVHGADKHVHATLNG